MLQRMVHAMTSAVLNNQQAAASSATAPTNPASSVVWSRLLGRVGSTQSQQGSPGSDDGGSKRGRELSEDAADSFAVRVGAEGHEMLAGGDGLYAVSLMNSTLAAAEWVSDLERWGSGGPFNLVESSTREYCR